MKKHVLIPLAAVALVVGGIVTVAHAATTATASCTDDPGVAVTCVLPYPAASTVTEAGPTSTVTATVTATATATVTASPTGSTSASPSATAPPTSPSPTSPTTTAPPPPSSGCATTTANVPDGPDGRGGCFPGTANTGPNARASTMATYTGPCTISTPNVVIDSKVVNCRTLVVAAGGSGLRLQNSYLNGGIVQSGGNAAFTVTDSLIDSGVQYPACSNGSCPAGKYACGSTTNQTTDCGVTGANFTILRTEITMSNRAAYCFTGCLIQDSYFHGTNLWPDKSNLAHASSVREEQGLTLRHNSLHCSYTGPFVNSDIGCSADLTGYPDFTAIKNNTVDGNLFVANTGNAFCAYGGGTAGKPFSSDPTNATNQKFTNNVFQRGTNGKCGAYAPVDSFITGRTGNVWSGNVWDSGGTVPPA